MDDIPPELQETIFLKLFETAQIARFEPFEPAERKAYENSLKYYRDLKNVTDTAREEGREEGREEEKLTMARKLKAKGFTDEGIIDITGVKITDGQK